MEITLCNWMEDWIEKKTGNGNVFTENHFANVHSEKKICLEAISGILQFLAWKIEENQRNQRKKILRFIKDDVFRWFLMIFFISLYYIGAMILSKSFILMMIKYRQWFFIDDDYYYDYYYDYDDDDDELHCSPNSITKTCEWKLNPKKKQTKPTNVSKNKMLMLLLMMILWFYLENIAANNDLAKNVERKKKPSTESKSIQKRKKRFGHQRPPNHFQHYDDDEINGYYHSEILEQEREKIDNQINQKMKWKEISLINRKNYFFHSIESSMVN